MRMIDADALEQALREAGLAGIIKDDCKYISAWGVPIVDAEPVKHGQWIFNPRDAIEMMFTWPRCSKCGVESPIGGNYCPNCGARMDEVGDEID